MVRLMYVDSSIAPLSHIDTNYTVYLPQMQLCPLASTIYVLITVDDNALK